jgi:thiamine biosynthesis lipoprotein
MYKESRVLMDTYCSITVVSSSREKAEKAIEAGFAEIKKLGTLINYYSDTSELSEINRSAGIKPVRVSKETLELINIAVHTSEITDGAFDPSIAPVIKLWDFSRQNKKPSVPASNYIKNAMKLVDFEKIQINDITSEVYLQEKGMEIDLGGIAKGYAADKAVDAIKIKGIKAALIAVAGDIRGFGLNTTGKPWNVGIQDPRPETESEKPWEDIIASLRLEDRAISTSGDYQRFFFQNGKRYHHILDPETGYPAYSDLISVTVIAPEGYVADGLSTAVFVLGIEKGLALINKLGLDAVLVGANRKVLVTENIKENIDLLDKRYVMQES